MRISDSFLRIFLKDVISLRMSLRISDGFRRVPLGFSMISSMIFYDFLKDVNSLRMPQRISKDSIWMPLRTGQARMTYALKDFPRMQPRTPLNISRRVSCECPQDVLEPPKDFLRIPPLNFPQDV